jgi:hypothetical protein
MKRILISVLLIVFCCCQFAYAGNTPTGDSKLDQSLEILSDGAKENTSEFAKKLGRKFGISEQTTERLLKRVGMSPGDVYMAAKVSKISKRSIEDVEDAYKENKGKGWGAIAKKLGIKPGSKEFHELKKDDSGILEEYRSKGKKGKKDKGKGKKGGPAEDDQEAAKNDKGEKKGFFERWFGGGKKE